MDERDVRAVRLWLLGQWKRRADIQHMAIVSDADIVAAIAVGERRLVDNPRAQEMSGMEATAAVMHGHAMAKMLIENLVIAVKRRVDGVDPGGTTVGDATLFVMAEHWLAAQKDELRADMDTATVLAPIARDGWGPGPWDDEPDYAAWVHAGFHCRAERQAESGAWSGYVTLPEGHPALLRDEGSWGVHGGITGGSRRTLGFDCGHIGDLRPGTPPNRGMYRSLAFVIGEANRLAEACRSIEPEPPRCTCPGPAGTPHDEGCPAAPSAKPKETQMPENEKTWGDRTELPPGWRWNPEAAGSAFVARDRNTSIEAHAAAEEHGNPVISPGKVHSTLWSHLTARVDEDTWVHGNAETYDRLSNEAIAAAWAKHDAITKEAYEAGYAAGAALEFDVIRTQLGELRTELEATRDAVVSDVQRDAAVLQISGALGYGPLQAVSTLVVRIVALRDEVTDGVIRENKLSREHDDLVEELVRLRAEAAQTEHAPRRESALAALHGRTISIVRDVLEADQAERDAILEAYDAHHVDGGEGGSGA